MEASLQEFRRCVFREPDNAHDLTTADFQFRSPLAVARPGSPVEEAADPTGCRQSIGIWAGLSDSDEIGRGQPAGVSHCRLEWLQELDTSKGARLKSTSLQGLHSRGELSRCGLQACVPCSCAELRRRTPDDLPESSPRASSTPSCRFRESPSAGTVHHYWSSHDQSTARARALHLSRCHGPWGKCPCLSISAIPEIGNASTAPLSLNFP
jgi:hypothetical protein